MGNDIDNRDSFYMNIQLIGLNMRNFYNQIYQSSLKNVIKYWKIEYLSNNNIENQINCYFKKLKNLKENKSNCTLNVRETLILKVNNIFDPEVNIIIEKINELSEKQYMPLVLILVNDLNYNLNIDLEEYDEIDPRLFFVAKYTENKYELEKKIIPILLRFCSIHNELGDNFSIQVENEEEKFDLIEKYFPFNLNIACIGRFGQGKSTGVNAILQEYKAKESNKGSSQTKKITFYQVKNNPIRILDIPGFESEKTVREAIKKFKSCGEQIKKMKDNLHIILYFLNFSEERAFMELEYPMLEEIIKHKSAKIIYVITHSRQTLKQKVKEKIFNRINSGIQGITQNKPIFNKIGKLKANENNVVFVNFHRDNINEIEPFGTRDLFRKIHDFFIISQDYQDSLNNLNQEIIEKRAKKLRAEAERILLPNKIWGAVVGIVPLVDLALQRFVIKKNAIEKVGQIFGFDSEFIDEENRRESEETTIGDIAEGTGRVASSAISYTSGGIAIGEGVASAVQASQLGVQAAQLGTQAANLGAKAAQLTQQANNMNSIAKFWYSITGTTSAVSKMAASTAAQASAAAAESANLAGQSAAAAGASTLSKFAGVGFLGIGCLIGIGVGGYTTYKFCEELLDKFENYFKNQPFIVRNSYIQAAQYFLI